jgi:hypothetical protein
MAVKLQVNSVLPVLLVIPAVGAVVLLVMSIDAVAVQPLVAVTVTVYVPAAVRLLAAVVVPLLQA